MIEYPSEAASRFGSAMAAVRRRWRRRVGGSRFVSNVVFMLAGTVLGQAASVLLSPILTRLYTPDQFGYLSVYTAALTILGVIGAAGFDGALPIAASAKELANLLAVSAVALLGTTGVLTLATWLLPDVLAATPWLAPLADYRFLLPIGFICLGSYYVMVAAATWLGAFQHIARTRITQGLSGPLSQIALGVAGAGAPGLAIGFVIGQSSGTFLLLARVYRDVPGLRGTVSWQGIAAVVRRYAYFPLFASWARVLEMAGSGPVLFLVFSACYSPQIAGYMFLTERVIGRPLLMVSTSLLQVFTGEAGQAVRQDPARFRRRFHQVVPRQLLLATGWILLANLLAGWAFPILFGQQWSAAIPYMRALSPAYLALAVLHPVSTSLQILERQVLAASWQAARLILVAGSSIAAWELGFPAVTALWVGSLAQVVACLAMLALIRLAIQRIQQR